MMRRATLAIMAALALAPRLSAQRITSPPPEDVEGRDEWFWDQREYPFHERPYLQMSLLHQNLPSYLRKLSLSASVSVLGGSWRPLGPTGLWISLLESGRIAAILPPATPGGPVYVATASGGVWRSNNNGLSWTPLTDNECALTTGAITRDPTSANTIYVATGEGNGGLAGCGVLRSTDGGASWTTGFQGLRSTSGAGGTFTSLLVEPTASNTLIGTTNFGNAGVVRSTNSGASWTAVLNTGPASSLTAHPTQARTYYVGNRVTTPATSRGVWKTTDAGATWSQLPAFPVNDVNAIGRVEVAVSPASPGSLWALVGDRGTGGFLGIFRWEESTNAWTQLAASGVTSAFGTQQTYDLVLTVDPVDTQRMYIAGVRAFRSLDGGATFQAMGNAVHSDWHVIALDPNDRNTLWVGTDGGVYISTDGGDTFVSRSAGLSITQFYPGVSVHPQGTRVAGGTQDNGTNVWQGIPVWDAFIGADGGYTAINYKDPNVQWGETQWSVSSGTVGNIFRRDALGTFKRSSGITTTDRAQFIPPLVMDPVNPAKLYFGTYRLYRTINDGQSWTALTGDLSNGTGTITTIAVSPSDTTVVWVGTSDGKALISRDGGLTFTPATGLPNRFVTRISPHPTEPLRALVTQSGFSSVTPTTPGHVFETTDGFATPVRNISGDLVDAPTNVAIYVPAAGVILAGTDVGVFQTANNGNVWTLGPSGMPNVIIQDLVYQPAAGIIVAGTYGRGMFVYDVGAATAVLRGDANGDGRVDAFDALLIQQALTGAGSSTTSIYPRGDANCNGIIDTADYLLVLRAAVGLPNGSACVGTVR